MSRKQQIFIIVLGLITVSFYILFAPEIDKSLGGLFYPPFTATASSTVVSLNRYTEPNGCAIQASQPTGEIAFQQQMLGSFSGTLRISGLNPNQSYVFTINGLQDNLGNNLLKKACPNSTNYVEGYCDYSVHANERGELSQLISIPLQPGQYAVKFFVKDPMQDYCPLLYDHSGLIFEIK